MAYIPMDERSKAVMIRAARPGEGRQVARYAGAAMHGRASRDWLANFARMTDNGIGPQTLNYSSRSTGRTGSVSTDPYLNVLDVGEPGLAGMSYSVQPMISIAKESGAPFELVPRVAARLVEVNLLAVHRRHRRQGHASALLADAECRYANAGYSLALVVVEYKLVPELIGWYERRGYVFPDPGAPSMIRLSSCGPEPPFVYGANDGQMIGFKALADVVSVARPAAGSLINTQKRPLPDGCVLAVGLVD